MSSTRHADTGSPFRQEKFSSNPAFDRGLMANLVARRVALLADPALRSLVWFIQFLSHAPGGLEKLADDLVALHPGDVFTPSMRKFAVAAGRKYSAAQVRTIRSELGCAWNETPFPLKGEGAPGCDHWIELKGERDEIERAPNPEWVRQSNAYPDGYLASEVMDYCRHRAATELPRFLSELCLNPDLDLNIAGKGGLPVYFPAVITRLHEFRVGWIRRRHEGRAVTEIGRQIHETLDYCRTAERGQQGEGCMVMIDGLARTGKTFALRDYCDRHAGRVRYIQVPSASDDIGFYRAIAQSLGVSVNLNSKAQQLRDRIEDALASGDIMLCFDEAHYLWPQSNYREALPGRVNWIMTGLVNRGVSVCLCCTPQFTRALKKAEHRSSWTSEQFIGRIAHYHKLPDSLAEADLQAVAKSFLPEGCARSIETLVVYAQGSAKYLAAIESVARRARFLARKDNRAKVIFADVRNAIKESVIPSDSAIAAALAEPKRNGRARAVPLPPPAPAAIENHLLPRRATRPALADSEQEIAAAEVPEVNRTGQTLAAA